MINYPRLKRNQLTKEVFLMELKKLATNEHNYNSLPQTLNSGIDDMESNKELPLDDAFDLINNLCNSSPYKPKSADNIYSDLAESRANYKRGEYEDFNKALEEISKEYNL